jgi:hypothetical protein
MSGLAGWPGGKRLSGNSRLGDYPSLLPHRVLFTKGGAEIGPLGPIDSPVVTKDDPTDINGWLRLIYYAILHSAPRMALEWKKRFNITPREAISFLSPGQLILAPGASGLVTALTVNPRFAGFVNFIGVGCTPIGGMSLVNWSLRVGADIANAIVHPGFNNLVFDANTTQIPLPFVFELTQGKVLSLEAVNNNLGPITLGGMFVGWTEQLDDYKEFGAIPSTSIQ